MYKLSVAKLMENTHLEVFCDLLLLEVPPQKVHLLGTFSIEGLEPCNGGGQRRKESAKDRHTNMALTRIYLRSHL